MKISSTMPHRESWNRQGKKDRLLSQKTFLWQCLYLYFFLRFSGWHLSSGIYTLLYEQIPNAHLDEIGMAYIWTTTIKCAALIIGPILFLAWLVAILADFIQVGPLVAIAPLVPKLDKLNPTKYFKNIMSIKTLFELFKNILKVAILGFIGWSVYKEHIESILMLAAIDNNFAVMIEFGKLITDFIFKACIAFLVIAAADYGVTKWKFLKDQKMSFKEIKDEYKRRSERESRPAPAPYANAAAGHDGRGAGSRFRCHKPYSRCLRAKIQAGRNGFSDAHRERHRINCKKNYSNCKRP